MRIRSRSCARQGVAAVELAVLLPLLAFLFVIGVDFARLFYHLITVTNCARNGAVYAADNATNAADTEAIKKAALADAKDLGTDPSVSSRTSTDADGNPCVLVTVSWNFHTLSRFPGVPDTVALSRTVQMRVAPKLPKGS